MQGNNGRNNQERKRMGYTGGPRITRSRTTRFRITRFCKRFQFPAQRDVVSHNAFLQTAAEVETRLYQKAFTLVSFTAARNALKPRLLFRPICLNLFQNLYAFLIPNCFPFLRHRSDAFISHQFFLIFFRIFMMIPNCFPFCANEASQFTSEIASGLTS